MKHWLPFLVNQPLHAFLIFVLPHIKGVTISAGMHELQIAVCLGFDAILIVFAIWATRSERRRKATIEQWRKQYKMRIPL